MRNGIGNTYKRVTDEARMDMISQAARFFNFLEFLRGVELDFVEKIFFVEEDGKIYAVLAYSEADAKQQVFWVRFQTRMMMPRMNSELNFFDDWRLSD